MDADAGEGGGGLPAAGDENIPRDARIVKSLLKSMGVEEYEPRVIPQFLELWYRYVVDVLTDAQVYSDHASKSAIDVDDVKLAIQTRVNSSFSQPPPREVLMELARSRNKIPLPKSIQSGGIPLPPEQYTLINPNYQLLIPKRQTAGSEADMEVDEEEEVAVDGDGSNSNPSPNNSAAPEQQQQQQRVSFAMTAGKRPR